MAIPRARLYEMMQHVELQAVTRVWSIEHSKPEIKSAFDALENRFETDGLPGPRPALLTEMAQIVENAAPGRWPAPYKRVIIGTFLRWKAEGVLP